MDHERDRRTARECCITCFVVCSLQYSTSRVSRQRCENNYFVRRNKIICKTDLSVRKKPRSVVKFRRPSVVVVGLRHTRDRRLRNIPFQNTTAVGLVAEVPVVRARQPDRSFGVHHKIPFPDDLEPVGGHAPPRTIAPARGGDADAAVTADASRHHSTAVRAVHRTHHAWSRRQSPKQPPLAGHQQHHLRYITLFHIA